MGRALGGGLGAAVLAATSLYGALRYGMPFTPDSWAFWQGSVGLLSGQGYSYVDGHPIIFWLPGFAFYLAAWQAMFGISVATLVSAQIALAAVAAFGWTALALSVDGTQRHRFLSAVVTALLTATVVSRSFHWPWGNFLLFALAPALLWAAVRLEDARTDQSTLLWAGVASLTLLAMLFAHNSAIAFLPPILLVVLLRKGMVRWPATALVLIAPALWWLARWLLTQLESVESTGGRYSKREYLRQLWYAVAGPFDSPWVPGSALLILILVLIPWTFLTRAQRLVIGISAAACIGLVVVFSRVWIWDGIYFRFTLFMSLALVGLIGTAFLRHQGWLRLVAAALVVGCAALTPAILVSPFLEPPPRRAAGVADVLDTSVLPMNATMSPAMAASGKFVLVEPPRAPRNHAEMMQLLATGKYGQ